MVFSSSLFVFAFLPLTYLLCSIVRSIKVRNNILIVASLLFYSFGRLDWLLLMIVSVVCNYVAGILMAKHASAKKAILTASLCINLGMLCVFKYLNFFTQTLDMLPFINITPTNIALPIGISFFTFQGMSYILDVYRNPEQASKDFGKVLLYIAFFPQLVAGPIVKYSDIADQIDCRKCSSELTVMGIRRFVLGLVKKLFFANTFGRITDIVYALDANALDFRLAWLGVICYVLQIYYDFSAYSDMAIGLGKMFGFHINENFRHPYCASSVKDFWRRWHISLSSWFRDYLYIPLGGNRLGLTRARINRLIVFFFTGMWHGANWTFIIWGLWHGLFLFIEDFLSDKKIKIPVLGNIYTLWVVAMGFMLFRASDLSEAYVMLKAMYTGFEFTTVGSLTLSNILTPSIIFMLIAGIICAMPVIDTAKRFAVKRDIKIPCTVSLAAVMIVFVMCVIKLASSSFNPFIYTQF